MIDVRKIAFCYPRGDYVFQDLSFQVQQGETLAILGANGAGKTTFIKCLMGFLKIERGDMFIEGKPVSSMKRKEFWKKAGYVPQAGKVSFGFTVLEMVVMGLSPYIGMGRLPKKEEYDRSQAMLSMLGIENLKDSPCNRISGGQLQMALIARALLKEPDIIIMDEPESHLDLKNQLKILNIIDNLNAKKDMAIIINTHYPQHALRVAHNTLILGSDSYLFGPSINIVKSDIMREYYGIHSKVMSHLEDEKKYFSVLPISLASQ